MFDRRCLFTFAVLLDLNIVLLPSIAYAQPTAPSSFCEAATVQIDNDEMGGTDRHYTGGVRIACVTLPPQYVRDLILSEPDPGAITHNRMTYAIGQSLFTPDDISQSDSIDDDQPYAGWLYLGFGVESEVIPKTDHLRYLDNIELQLGVIGPLSGAEQVQRIGHDLTNATDPRGWGNQLDNEPGINFFYSRQLDGCQRIRRHNK